MGYISKSNLLRAYFMLSTNTDSPSSQGATQKVSALRYLFALDRFYVFHKKDCDVKSPDKNLFVKYVGEIVKLSDSFYTSNFYLGLNQDSDYKVGSNFFSVNAVNDSIVNPSVIVNFPRRSKDGELIQIKNGVLLHNDSLYAHVTKYLSTDEICIAFALWLIREIDLKGPSFSDIKDSLLKRYSKELIELLLPKEDVFKKYFFDNGELIIENEMAVVTRSDIESMFEKEIKYDEMDGVEQDVSFPNIPYIVALLTKPFLLLAGISGTGKSRIVRELARACWKPDSEEFKAHKPSNFEMIQVKPNWHDSSELLGYVSRISGKPEFVAGDFLRFIVKAWENRNVPCFLCLDEMNLAPVEQYFAEYLSVIETRKLENGEIVTDPILKVNAEQWYIDLIHKLTSDEILSKQFLERGIAIPQNLFVVGTVNMDETTFSFSRKVLDRAMTIEMNEVDLEGGLENDGGDGFGYIGEALHAQFVEGKDVYSDYKELCDKVITYQKSVNEKLEGTPFKIAYRTRNEFLVYAVNRWLLSDGQDVFLNAIDEMTSMKILSRIEGDADKVGSVLDDLKSLLEGAFGESELKTSSVSLSKLKGMTKKLEKTQYTSFWL